mmetsp:Transcript_20705/g.53421  ORF Transcript_20705/g.53421 Transcript_20705/m.53421 type:complete len:202 (-) Transcript_20705:167-772(-)
MVLQSQRRPSPTMLDSSLPRLKTSLQLRTASVKTLVQPRRTLASSTSTNFPTTCLAMVVTNPPPSSTREVDLFPPHSLPAGGTSASTPATSLLSSAFSTRCTKTFSSLAKRASLPMAMLMLKCSSTESGLWKDYHVWRSHQKRQSTAINLILINQKKKLEGERRRKVPYSWIFECLDVWLEPMRPYSTFLLVIFFSLLFPT